MNVGFFNKDQEQINTRKVSKAFLITGGTEEKRREKYIQLCTDEQFLMYASYKGENELAVIFSCHHSDFEGMNFEEAKKIAGSQELGCNIRIGTFDYEHRFGLINVTGSRP